MYTMNKMMFEFDPGKYMKANEFDKKFDLGEDISNCLDLSKAKRPGQEQKRIKYGFPGLDDTIPG